MDQRTRIRGEIDETTESIVEKIEQMDEALEELKTDAREFFGDFKHDARERIGDLKHDAREAVSLEHHVRERPLPMFGAAIALGFAVDRLLL